MDLSSDESEGRARQFQAHVRTDKPLARTLEDVSHVFLSSENAGSGIPNGLSDRSAQIQKGHELLKRAVADLTLDNLILKDAAKKLMEIEKENQLLKRAVADLTLDNLILKDAAKGNV